MTPTIMYPWGILSINYHKSRISSGLIENGLHAFNLHEMASPTEDVLPRENCTSATANDQKFYVSKATDKIFLICTSSTHYEKRLVNSCMVSLFPPGVLLAPVNTPSASFSFFSCNAMIFSSTVSFMMNLVWKKILKSLEFFIFDEPFIKSPTPPFNKVCSPVDENFPLLANPVDSVASLSLQLQN